MVDTIEPTEDELEEGRRLFVRRRARERAMPIAGLNETWDHVLDPPAVDSPELFADQEAAHDVEPPDMLGPYDAWLGKVDTVRTDGTHALSGFAQEIFVTRVGLNYQDNNEPQGFPIPSVFGQLGAAGVTALPWPVRHDQTQYIVAEGDIVTVLTGRDNRHYFMVDDLPFLAQVKSDGGATTEANAGGAGLTALSVIRKALAGDPTSTLVTGFNDLQDAASADITYADVLPVGPLNSAHGYRTGDLVWVQRRGVYMFCQKAPKTFVAELKVGAGTGPEGEGDLTGTNRYWFQEQTPTLTYTNNAYTFSFAQLTQTDPTGSGGRYGRWGAAVNLAEATDAHALNNGALVMVSEIADGSSQEIGYVFSRNPTTAGTDIYIDVVQDNEEVQHTVSPCDQITFAGAGKTTAVVTNQGGGNALVTITTPLGAGLVSGDHTTVAGGAGEIQVNHDPPASTADTFTVSGSGELSGTGNVTYDSLGHINADTDATLTLDAPVDPSGSVDTLGDATEGSLAPDATSWTSGGVNGVAVWVQTREFYDHTASPPTLYGFKRLKTYTATGRLYSVSGETRYEVDETEPCP